MRGRSVALTLLLGSISFVLFLGTGELALRLFYRDAGTRTLGGPGGHGFVHLTAQGDQRGRFDTGPKDPNKPRILIIGDSITWGQGVRRWEDTWPEQLAQALERAGAPHEMAVVALPGRDIVQHVDEVEHWAPQLDPDVFIYQWYVNDIEVDARRPANVRAWRTWPTHDVLSRSSYLYFFLDNRLDALLTPPDRSYVEYILEDYAPGTLEWAEFERYFHRLAVRAMAAAPTRVLLLYPQVPFRGSYPLAPIHQRVTALAGAHLLTIPPAAWTRHAGHLIDDRSAPFKQALRVAAHAGAVLETREYLMPPGGFDVVLTMWQERPGAAAATLEAFEATTNVLVDSAPVIAATASTGWGELTVHLEAPQKPSPVRLRLSSAASMPFAVASLAIPVDYGFVVVDTTDALNAFDTHASVFDAHPNARAHRVLAAQVFDALRRAGSVR